LQSAISKASPDTSFISTSKNHSITKRLFPTGVLTNATILIILLIFQKMHVIISRLPGQLPRLAEAGEVDALLNDLAHR
jgi:hypothetical protein